MIVEKLAVPSIYDKIYPKPQFLMLCLLKILIWIKSTKVMDLEDILPLVVYDNQCYLCTKFAKVVNFLARGKFSFVGHYSPLGEKLRNEILDSSALEMFWFIDKKTAYGGRAALGPLFNAILTIKEIKGNTISFEESCDTECKTAKAVFIRSASLLTNSKKIKLGQTTK